jgi:hypothetical protein
LEVQKWKLHKKGNRKETNIEEMLNEDEYSTIEYIKDATKCTGYNFP